MLAIAIRNEIIHKNKQNFKYFRLIVEKCNFDYQDVDYKFQKISYISGEFRQNRNFYIQTNCPTAPYVIICVTKVP
ncbi:unnamed protein product [Rhizophagus irregularis]|nr:unnamed protein product [Rhizophagus irregularis]